MEDAALEIARADKLLVGSAGCANADCAWSKGTGVTEKWLLAVGAIDWLFAEGAVRQITSAQSSKDILTL